MLNVLSHFLRQRLVLSLALLLLTMLLISTTSDDYGVTWDEPPYFTASDLHIAWLRRALEKGTQREWSAIVDDKEIQAAWHWNPYNVPHPPLSRIVSGALKAIAPHSLAEISAYRLGPALFFSVLVALMFIWISELFGIAAGVFSAFAVILIPHLFGYAHFAVTDMPLAVMWFATAYCFYKGLSDWRWSVLLGMVWGLAISTKFPALLILIPLILWAHLFHRNKYVNNLFAMLFFAPIFVVATQPYLWHQTGLRILEFLYEGISRGYRAETNFSVFFNNQVLYSQQLPWHYPFLLIGITTPEGILALMLFGLAFAWKSDCRDVILLFFINGSFILLLGVMPGAVLHDGTRQLLSSFPFIAALAGVGFYSLSNCLQSFARARFGSCTINLRNKIYLMMFLLLGFSPALDLYLTHPYQLSFYNRFVGGIRGAYERGLETTYFLEALTPEFIDELNRRLPNHSRIQASFADTMLVYYQSKGRLRQDLQITATAPYDYLVLVNRRSALSPRERTLIDTSSNPFISVELGGVPLVSVFDLTRFRRESAATAVPR